jgi:hypothetical protein
MRTADAGSVKTGTGHRHGTASSQGIGQEIEERRAAEAALPCVDIDDAIGAGAIMLTPAPSVASNVAPAALCILIVFSFQALLGHFI